MALHQAGRLLGQLQRAGVPAALPAALQLVSWLNSDAKSNVDAVEVAHALRANEFATSHLLDLRADKSAISHPELLEYMHGRGFTPAAASDVVDRLERSGALLNMRGTIMLRPGEVAEALALVLPSSVDAARQRLASAQQELAEVDGQQAKIGRRAAWRHRGLVWAGFSSQMALYGLLYRLTFYELSWDVMEPICFFVGGAQALMCYAFFMLTRSEFTWEVALDRAVSKWEAEQLQRAGFDGGQYARLREEVQRLTDLVAAAEQQAAARARADAGDAKQQQQQEGGAQAA